MDSNLTALPVELQLHVMRHLDLAALFALARTCRDMRDLGAAVASAGTRLTGGGVQCAPRASTGATRCRQRWALRTALHARATRRKFCGARAVRLSRCVRCEPQTAGTCCSGTRR